jgi:hypothetical protein
MHGLDSPFIVPVAAFALVLGIIVVANISNYHNRRLKSEERLAAIAKGLPLPPDPETDLVAGRTAYVDRPQNARGLRTGGIVCISVGVGMGLFSFFLAWIVQEHDVLAVGAAGLIPLAIGVGLLVDYGLRVRGVAQKQD